MYTIARPDVCGQSAPSQTRVPFVLPRDIPTSEELTHDLSYLPWNQSPATISSLTSNQVADACVSLNEHIKLLGLTLDNRLSFDKHV